MAGRGAVGGASPAGLAADPRRMKAAGAHLLGERQQRPVGQLGDRFDPAVERGRFAEVGDRRELDRRARERRRRARIAPDAMRLLEADGEAAVGERREPLGIGAPADHAPSRGIDQRAEPRLDETERRPARIALQPRLEEVPAIRDHQDPVGGGVERQIRPPAEARVAAVQDHPAEEIHPPDRAAARVGGIERDRFGEHRHRLRGGGANANGAGETAGAVREETASSEDAPQTPTPLVLNQARQRGQASAEASAL